MRVKVSGSAVVNGRISADGQKAHGKYGGGGAGGSIWLEADSLVGNGVISAAGGDYNSATTGAGGGGRIYLKYSDGEMFTGTIDVAGGLGPSSSWHGAAGGVIIQDAAAPNVPPDMPELLYPAEGERLHAPYLQLSAYDDDDDLLRFKVEVASDSGFANIVRTIDQNMSQALWRGQMESGHTAYSGGQIATVIIAPPLAPDTTYYWRAYAIDYDGSGQWGDVSDIYSFSTFATAANWWVCEPNELVGDRKWENPDNWSTQNVPQPGEAVRFGGLFFDVPCVASIVSNDLHSLTIESAWGSTLTMASNAVAGTAMEWSFSNDITLENGTIEFYNDTSAIGGGSAESPHGCGYRIMADNMRISASAVLHADSRGFPAQQGPGKRIAGTSDDRGNGAGHGGFGGFGEKSPGAATRGVIYGSTNFPTALGSGGTSGTYSPPGGGAIWLELRGDLNLNGRLSANAPDALRARAGGSSGGSLFVAANCINGNGIIAANGGNSGTSSAAGGGGGGRISLLFGQTAEQRRAIIAGEMERFELLAEQPTHFSGNISALGGVGQYSHPPNAAENGTIVFIRALPSPGTFIIIR